LPQNVLQKTGAEKEVFRGSLKHVLIQDYEKKQIKKVLNTKDVFDLLITHDKDDSSERGYGMAEIREMLHL
jgi:hypothetical protein